MAKRKTTIKVNDIDVRVVNQESGEDYICITDIAKNFEVGVAAIESWMRNRNTISDSTELKVMLV